MSDWRRDLELTATEPGLDASDRLAAHIETLERQLDEAREALQNAGEGMTPDLLARVHKRLGLGVDITTFADGHIEVRWRRDYGEGYGWSDERFLVANSLREALQGILDYEDAADAEDEKVDRQ